MSKGAILITGASSGIGHAAALHLADAGYTVFAGVRNEADRERLALERPNLRPIVLDVTVPADLSRAMESVAASGEPLAGLVNNAGIAVGGPLEYLPMEEIRRQFEVNVYAPIAMTQAALPLLRASRGRIVFVGSIAGRLSAPFVGPYSASKAALASLVDALRQELASTGISVSLLEFASVKTPIWAKGRTGKDRLVEVMPPEATQRYAPLVNAIVNVTQHEERHGMEPAVIAAAILQTLQGPKPRERYLIGTSARMQAVIALLPARTKDALVRKAMRLP
jgi:NAD(P)-dependent dehydrogenase (short-subunit alcohol dehydrogenase family)